MADSKVSRRSENLHWFNCGIIDESESNGKVSQEGRRSDRHSDENEDDDDIDVFLVVVIVS